MTPQELERYAVVVSSDTLQGFTKEAAADFIWKMHNAHFDTGVFFPAIGISDGDGYTHYFEIIPPSTQDENHTYAFMNWLLTPDGQEVEDAEMHFEHADEELIKTLIAQRLVEQALI